ncbi:MULTISPECIES: LuxR family transcriptional regulator [Nocardioides]|uniref:LuxR family transcriptional regulator n=1 Tax=Nocardioides kribbensis TaxID=305517 RepID=A0ABV1P2V4_9ACTN|nr:MULTISPECIES: LuxR family transcriptional regulator [Nocardioides]MCM3516575.1 LuxR family transcriptional regulator [Nocardioides sp. P86]
MAVFGPEDRAAFEEHCVALYEDMVAAGGIAADDPRVAEGADDRPAFDLLVQLGLVSLDADSATWLPEDPAAVQSRVVTPLSAEAGRLLEESSQWARAFGPLRQAWRRAPETGGRGPFTYLRGAAIGPYIGGLTAETESELLTAQPQTGRDPQTLAEAALRDTAALARGVRMRTLYQHSARRSAVTHKYVAAVTGLGAEVRTLDEFFNRMIVVDRRVVVIPATDDNTLAIAVREPSVVAYLVDVFERAWERARPFGNRESTTMKDIAEEQRAMTIRMLIEGHADPVSAKRLGVSPRTYAGYVADLKAEHDADTRFQLGYLMGRRGVQGDRALDGETGAPDQE